MVIGTPKLKQSRQLSDITIDINDEIIHESQSEKILGVIFNNEMTFRHHLYGNDEFEGLVTQLKKRVGILYRLSKQI